MAKTSAILTSTDADGKALQKSLTDINPDISSDVLVTFARKLNGITGNSYVSTVRIDKTICDAEEAPIDPRPVPTISLTINNVAVTSLSESDFLGKKTGDLKTNSDGVMYYYLKGTKNLFFNVVYGTLTALGGMAELTANAPRLVPGTLVLGVLATDNYQAREIEIPVTA